MKRPELITLRNTLIEYRVMLGDHSNPRVKEVESVVEHLEQFVNRMPPESAPESTIAQAAAPSPISGEELSVRIGLLIAKNVPPTFGYMFLLIGGDRKMQFVTTTSPQASVALLRDFIAQLEKSPLPPGL